VLRAILFDGCEPGASTLGRYAEPGSPNSLGPRSSSVMIGAPATNHDLVGKIHRHEQEQ
jgi:hypothetical protein